MHYKGYHKFLLTNYGRSKDVYYGLYSISYTTSTSRSSNVTPNYLKLMRMKLDQAHTSLGFKWFWVSIIANNISDKELCLKFSRKNVSKPSRNVFYFWSNFKRNSSLAF